MGTFKCRTTTERAPRPAHASRPPSRAAFPPAPTSCLIFWGFQSHFAASCAKPTAPTHLDENAAHGTHFSVTTFADRPLKKAPIDSRARSAVWVAWFVVLCRVAFLVDWKCQKARGKSGARSQLNGALDPFSRDSPGHNRVASGGCGPTENGAWPKRLPIATFG